MFMWRLDSNNLPLLRIRVCKSLRRTVPDSGEQKLGVCCVTAHDEGKQKPAEVSVTVMKASRESDVREAWPRPALLAPVNYFCQS